MDSQQSFFVIIIITITAREEICKSDQVLALMEQQDNTAWSSSDGELAVEHMCYIVGLNDRRKSRTTSGGRRGWWQLHHGNGGRRGLGSVSPLHHHHNRWAGCCPAWPALIAADWLKERSHKKSSSASLGRKRGGGRGFQCEKKLFKCQLLCGF